MPARPSASPIARLVVTACLMATSLAVASGAAAAVDSTPIFPGWTAHASTVTCPSKAPRTLTSEETATFLQSWLPDSLYKTLPQHKPPSGLPECTITVRYTVSGTDQPELRIRYVSDGHSAWISSDLGRWVVAPQSRRVILSFEGHGTYVPVVAASASVPSTTSPAQSKPPVKKSNPAPSWLLVLAAAILVGGIVLLVVRRGGAGSVGPGKPTARP